MRLLHVYAGPFPSHQGTQAYLAQLLRAQVRQGHRVSLRCWSGGVGPVPPGVEVRRLPARPGSERLKSGPHPSRAPLALDLLRAVRRDLRQPFDLVHAHHVEAPLLARLVGARPLIHHLHTALSEELPTYGVPGGRLVGAALDRACVRLAHGTLALSERGASLARRWGARRALSVPPGLPEVRGHADRARERFDLPEHVIVYTGNLDAYQELDRLVRAAASHDLPVLVVTGDDPASLLRQARQAGAHRLRAIRTRALADHLDLLAAATVSVVPRSRLAGVPIKLLNSLAVGTPGVVVQGAVDAWPGVVQAPAAALGATLQTLLADPARRRTLARQLAHRQTELSWQARVREIQAFQAMLLAL